MEITKRKLVQIWPSEEAVRLANNIYHTYIQEGSPYLHISLQLLCRLFGDCEGDRVKEHIVALLEELNEPIAIENVTLKGKKIDWQVLRFLRYGFSSENGKEYLDIEINESYLEALSTLEAEPYINFR